MFRILTTLIATLFCSFYQCEWSLYPPFVSTHIYENPFFRRSRILATDIRRLGSLSEDENTDLVLTKLGPVQGFKMKISDTRKILAFTGVPYGETTGGENRFRAPVPKRPWTGTWDATYPSPMCVQITPFAAGRDKIRGNEDCLHLDIYTPRIPKNESGPLFPVFIFVPGGSFWFGDSKKYGPERILLDKDILLIVINVRMELFGWLSNGESANWALKDQGLAIEWVYQNIQGFGGDPNKIIIGGVSSSAVTTHLMLFTNHRARNYVKGIMSFSGSALFGALDVHGHVRDISDAAAESVGCPNSRGINGSKNMVECLRKVPAFLLVNLQRLARLQLPPAMFIPTLELPGPSAFISEPPEVQYRKGTVPPIPLIITRAEDELQMELLPLRPFLPLMLRPLLYFRFMPILLHYAFRTSSTKVDPSVAQASFRKVHQAYFGKNTAPNFLIGQDYSIFCQLLNDALVNAPMWKSIEYHHKIAPTYTYIQKNNVIADLPMLAFARNTLKRFGNGHGSEIGLLFNMSKIIPPIIPGSDFDVASRRLINMIANFATHGAPLYRNEEGQLLNLWKPVEDMKNPIALEVGLVNDIKMIVDPVAASGRLHIWEEVVF